MVGITRKTTKMIGIAVIVIGLSLFGVSYNQGTLGQNVYSNLGCAINGTPNSCTIANNQMTAGFIGMIFGFFIAFFGASLVVPSVLAKMISKVRKVVKQ